MIDFFDHFKIKHDDLPYILTYLGIFATIIVIALLLADLPTAILIAAFFLTVLILVVAFHFYRAHEALHVRQQQKMQAYMSLYKLIDFRLPPPYMTSWAATPELAVAIYEIIKTEQPENIVELGSGISSLICAYAMEANDKGALYSLDHDPEYGQKTKTMLAEHQIDQRVSVSYAPLKSQTIDGRNCTWYDCSDAEYPESIDLLIVDGPPYETQRKVRYPALPYFMPRLSSTATIIIHDAFRDDESEIVSEWLHQYPEFVKETIYSEKGIVILRRQPH